MEYVLVPLALLGVVAIVIGSYYLKRKRREALAAMANQLGLSYSREDTAGCLSLPFALLQRGDGRGTESLLSGTWQEMPIREFDYWY